MASEQTGWDHRYRRLSEGETILPTDECQNDDGGWKVTRPEVAGSKAPNPDYTSHRTYRRLAAPTPPPASADALGEVERVMAAMQYWTHGEADIRGLVWVHGPNGYKSSHADSDEAHAQAKRMNATAALSAMSPAGEVERNTCEMPEVVAMRYIEELRSDYGSVTILPDNDEADTRDQQMAIDCCSEWTNWLDQRFYGESVIQCLAKAVGTRAKSLALKGPSQ